MVKFSDLHVKVEKGTVLKIFWEPISKERINIVRAEIADFVPSDCTYIKTIDGNTVRPANKPFAFIEDCFIPPKMVREYNITGGEIASFMAVYDYNKKKKKWTWICVL